MSNWRTCTIGDLVKEKVIFPPMDGNHGEIHPKGNDFVSEGIPFVMASDINDSLIDLTGCKYISKKQADGLRKGFAHEGDVLLTHKATIGRTAVVPHIKYPYLMLTPQVTYYRVIDTSALNNRFLKYYFDYKPFQETLGLWAGAGSTRAYLGITGQHNLTIRIPDIDTQQKIAAVLAAIDKKIKLNNRINAELEAMAKTLYDYWFVQFDFPDDSPQGQGKPYKTSGGKMVYNPTLKREIPEGWEVVSLVDIASFINGIACQRYFPKEDETGVLKVIKIREFSSGLDENSDVVIADIPEELIIQDGDVLFSWSATLDVKLWAGGVGALNQHIFKVTSDSYPKTFYYFEVLRYLEHFKMIAALRKTTMGHITKDHLAWGRISHPPKELIQAIDAKLSPMLSKIIINNQQNTKLAKLRDWLLPMLMNGQVTVK
jgi:type I restriction enzyme S subunit